MSSNEALIVSGICSAFHTSNWKEIIDILRIYKNREVIVEDNMLHAYRISWFKYIATMRTTASGSISARVPNDSKAYTVPYTRYKFTWTVLDSFPSLLDYVDAPDDTQLSKDVNIPDMKIRVALNEKHKIDGESHIFDINNISKDSLAMLLYIILSEDRTVYISEDKIWCKIKTSEFITYLLNERITLMNQLKDAGVKLSCK